MSIHPAHSAACCTVPPVVTGKYEPKGKYVTIDGLKMYQTGPTDSKQAILIIYDIFGYFPQTLQGADILAHGDKENPRAVFMPDFFDGKPADISWYPPDNEEKGKKLGEFFSGIAAPPKTVAKVPGVVKSIQKEYGSLREWGVVGYCWGGKIVNLTSQSGTPFQAAVAVHPAMIDAADAPKVTIPIALLPSKGEPKEDVEKYEKELKVKHVVEWFPDQVHGFMAARGDLSDEKVKKEYERGYKLILNFFHEHMGTTSSKI